MTGPIEIALVAALRRLGGAPVYQLAEELQAGQHLVEGLLRDLRRRGQARVSLEGSPPVATWRVAR